MESSADVVVVGSGLIGAGIARRLRARAPAARILMLEGGPALFGLPGVHTGILSGRSVGSSQSSSASGPYTGAETYSRTFADSSGQAPGGLYDLAALGHEPGELIGALQAWNVGGMGVFWGALTPSPSGSEIPAVIDQHVWSECHQVAKETLRVGDSPFSSTSGDGWVLAREMCGRLGRSETELRPMPMALTRGSAGSGVRRVSSADVFPPMLLGGDGGFSLRRAMCTRFEEDSSGRVRVEVLDGDDAHVSTLRCRKIVVCADVFRTPQLLWTSGLRPPALGSYLNEHTTVSASVDVAAGDGRRRVETTTTTCHLLTVGDGVDRMHCQLMSGPRAGSQDGITISVIAQVPTRIEPANHLDFADRRDVFGLPAVEVSVTRSEEDDRRLVAVAELVQCTLRAVSGGAIPKVAYYPAGASLHATGTVRMGARDDGTSVCDPTGRVWGTQSVYVAGNGTIPTALACNSTLTAMTLAVVSADRVAEQL